MSRILAAFLLALRSAHSSSREKELIIQTLDDWDVLTPTWFELANYLDVIEGLYEDETFKERLRAALLASKVGDVYVNRGQELSKKCC